MLFVLTVSLTYASPALFDWLLLKRDLIKTILVVLLPSVLLGVTQIQNFDLWSLSNRRFQERGTVLVFAPLGIELGVFIIIFMIMFLRNQRWICEEVLSFKGW